MSFERAMVGLWPLGKIRRGYSCTAKNNFIYAVFSLRNACRHEIVGKSFRPVYRCAAVLHSLSGM